MKNLFKQTKVIYDDHQKEYQVYYRNFFVWHFDSCYKYNTDHHYTPGYFQKQEEAKERAIQRAQAMLNTIEVWRGSNFGPYM